jgi:hypothetical protein
MLMEFLLIRHGRMPGAYLRCPPGERVLAKALFLTHLREEAERLGD